MNGVGGATIECPSCHLEVAAQPRCEMCGSPLPPVMPKSERQEESWSAPPEPIEAPDPIEAEEAPASIDAPEAADEPAFEDPLPIAEIDDVSPLPDPGPTEPVEAGDAPPPDQPPAESEAPPADRADAAPEPAAKPPEVSRTEPKAPVSAAGDGDFEPVAPPAPDPGPIRDLGPDPIPGHGARRDPVPGPSPSRPDFMTPTGAKALARRLFLDFQFEGRMARDAYWKMFAIRAGIILVCLLLAAQGLTGGGSGAGMGGQYPGPGDRTYPGPGGQANPGPGGQANPGPGGQMYQGPDVQMYPGPGGQANPGPGGQMYQGPDGRMYPVPDGQMYQGPDGQMYPGPDGQANPGQGGQANPEPDGETYPMTGMMYSGTSGEMGGDVGEGALLSALAILLMIWISAAGLGEAARRLHDTGKSGWWSLINLVPYLGFFVWIFLLAQPGKPGDNEHGPAPGANAAA